MLRQNVTSRYHPPIHHPLQPHTTPLITHKHDCGRLSWSSTRASWSRSCLDVFTRSSLPPNTQQTHNSLQCGNTASHGTEGQPAPRKGLLLLLTAFGLRRSL